MLPQLVNDPGPILTYLQKLALHDSDAADKARLMVRAMLATPEGAMFLDLLEKSTQLSQTPVLADPRALEARNAQGFIASDLKRIASDEHERLAERNANRADARRAVARGT